MNELTVINKDGKFVVDSREVAEMVEKRHSDLIRDIRGYLEILGKRNFTLADFFIESTYFDSQCKERPCYLITRKGCDMVANKMTGEKGVLFTAAYVIKFEEMEKTLKINPNRSSYRDLASLMREWRLWAKEMKMPANQAMKLLI
jgi:Rha family phage regulatory protein